jgi:hypothetical protein
MKNGLRGHNPQNLMSTMWRNWAVATGALMLPMASSLFLPKIWLPFLALAEVYVLVSLRKAAIASAVSNCSALAGIAIRSLFTSALIMLAINILCTDWLVPASFHLELYNSEIPFITCLIVFPVTAVYCGLFLLLGLGSRTCRECQGRNGFYAGDSVVGTLYYREVSYQTAILLLLSVVLGAIEYWYYFARYINSDLNDPDRFFFTYMPLAMYLLSLLFMAGRYASMHTLYTAMRGDAASGTSTTMVRFLVFCNDDMLLHQGADGRWDTPAESVIRRSESLGEHEARLLFVEKTGISNFGLRYCFNGRGFSTNSNILHYAAFVSPEEKDNFDPSDLWFNPYMLDRGLATNTLSPVLANELYRIHTITMAWKTYDRNGRRLYPIKHYRPTFRFRDLQNWCVDYDDESWFGIAHHNEDRRFFRTRQFFDKITNIFNRKKKAQG